MEAKKADQMVYNGLQGETRAWCKGVQGYTEVHEFNRSFNKSVNWPTNQPNNQSIKTLFGIIALSCSFR